MRVIDPIGAFTADKTKGKSDPLGLYKKDAAPAAPSVAPTPAAPGDSKAYAQSSVKTNKGVSPFGLLETTGTLKGLLGN